jgi:GTP-binding protein Era
MSGEKVAATSSKPQTTRFSILTIKEFDRAQIAFVDTPGLGVSSTKERAKGRRTDRTDRTDRTAAPPELLRKISDKALKHADEVVFVVDVTADKIKNALLLERLLDQYGDAKFFVAFNKIDKVKRSKVIETAVTFQKFEQIEEFFMIAAQHGDGVDMLLQSVVAHIPEQEWMYPPQRGKDLKRWTSEMTMEKIFVNLHEEVPYQTYVDTRSIQESEEGLHIYQDIVVAKDGQKPIVVGKRGQMLKKIGMDARMDIAKILHRRVHLYLLVKVKEDWMNKTSNLIDAGFFEDFTT